MPSRASRAAERLAQDKASREAGTRETPTGAKLTAVPDTQPEPPAEAPVDDIAKAAADLFAAMSAGMGGAAAPPTTVADAVGKPPEDQPAPPVPPKPKPLPKPEAAKPPKPARQKPAPKPKPAPPPADPNAPVDDCTRFIGTVTETVLADGGTTEDVVHDCQHAATNGHMSVDAAFGCAKKLLRNYPGGVTGTRPHPVRRDRNGAKVG